MSSLRRPSQVLTKAQAQSVKESLRPPLPDDAVQKRDARKSKIGDRIKKRMSMRYAGTDDLLDQAVPPLPTQSAYLDNDPYQGISISQHELEDGTSRFGQFASDDFQNSGFGRRGDEGIRRRGGQDMTKEEEWRFDEMDKDGFDVQAYLKRTLMGADEDEIKRFKAALQRSKQANAKELKRNVFKQ